MTLKTNARVAGFTFFVYLAAGISSLVLFGRATSGEGIAAKLAGIAQHATNVRITMVMIPIPLAWLGVFASVLLVVGLPLELAGFLRGRVTWFIWIPMLAFEMPLALWLLIKGVRTSNSYSSTFNAS